MTFFALPAKCVSDLPTPAFGAPRAPSEASAAVPSEKPAEAKKWRRVRFAAYRSKGCMVGFLVSRGRGRQGAVFSPAGAGCHSPGQRPGLKHPQPLALKGRHTPPFQGYSHMLFATQGVALGYDIPPLRGYGIVWSSSSHRQIDDLLDRE